MSMMTNSVWNNYQEVMKLREARKQKRYDKAVYDEERIVSIFSRAWPAKDEHAVRIAVRKVCVYGGKSLPDVELVNEIMKVLEV